MRVSHEAQYTRALGGLQRRLGSMTEAQERVGSGRAFSRASEDPRRASSVMALRSRHRAAEQHARNAADALSRLQVTDGRLQDASSILQRVKELAVRASSHVSPTERQAIATELTGVRDELLAIANSEIEGQGIFAGTAHGRAVEQIAGAWTYSGDTGRIQRTVGEAETVHVNVTAERAFGFSDGADVFSLLDELSSAVIAGDRSRIDGAAAQVAGAHDRVLESLAEIGVSSRRVERSIQRGSSEELSIRAQLSAVQDVDLAGAVMELQMQEVAFQATLRAMSHAVQPSLADFLG